MFTNYKKDFDSALVLVGTDAQGLITSGQKATSGAPATTAGIFQVGAFIQNIATGVLYVNVGTTASPSWTIIDTASGLALTNGHIFVGNASNLPTDVAMSGDVTIANTGLTTIANDAVNTTKIANASVTTAKIDNFAVTGAKMITGVGYFTVAADTNGTTPVDVIAATVPFACTITGVYLISEDTTAGNITLADTAGTVATIAKGTSAGVMVGATSLANTSVALGDTLTIVSSSAGNARVFITFTTA